MSIVSPELELEALRQHERTDRPLGSEAFIAGLEAKQKRPLQKRRPGRPRTRGKQAAS